MSEISSEEKVQPKKGLDLLTDWISKALPQLEKQEKMAEEDIEYERVQKHLKRQAIKRDKILKERQARKKK